MYLERTQLSFGIPSHLFNLINNRTIFWQPEEKFENGVRSGYAIIIMDFIKGKFQRKGQWRIIL